MGFRPFRFRAVKALVVGLAGVGAAACTEPGDGDPAAPPSCSADTYRIADVDLAATWGDAVRLGLDMDGDGDVDNKLGSLNATLTQVYGDWRPDEAIDALLGRATTGWMMKVERCPATQRLAIHVAVGGDADGDGAFEVADWGEPAVGWANRARGGVGFLPTGRLGAGTGTAVGAGSAGG
jgi:hypothetical protein